MLVAACLLLGTASFVVACAIGIVTGVLSVQPRGTNFDRLLMPAMIMGISMRRFFLGILVIVAFAFEITLFSMIGMSST